MVFRKIVLSMLLLGVAQLSFAAGATKVAVLDLQATVLMSEAGKSGMGELEKNAEYTSLKAKLENIEADLKGMDDKLKNEGLTWGDDKKETHRGKMSDIAQERQAAMTTLNRARESVFVQLLDMMEPSIGAALEEIMAAEGIELVLDAKAAVHKMPTADITPMVVEKVNKLNAAAAAEAQKQKKGKSE